MQGLENNTFNVGASSNPAKFSKLLKNIKNYIQKTYKDPDDMVKTVQQMKRVILNYPKKPKKTDAACCDANRDPDPDMFKMAVFAWKEDYKSMKSRMDRYKGNVQCMGIDLQPMLCRTEEQAGRDARLQYSKEWEQCGQTIDDDLWILLSIQPTEQRIHGNRDGYKGPIFFSPEDRAIEC